MINWIQLISSFLGSYGFALMFRLTKGKAFWTALGGGIAWFVYLMIGLVYDSYGVQFLLSAIVLGFYCEIMAVKTKMPRTAYIAVGIIPLIPGAALYHTMYYFFLKQSDKSLAYGLEAVITSVSIAAGLVVAMMAWKVFKQAKSRNMQKEMLKETVKDERKKESDKQ